MTYLYEMVVVGTTDNREFYIFSFSVFCIHEFQFFYFMFFFFFFLLFSFFNMLRSKKTQEPYILIIIYLLVSSINTFHKLVKSNFIFPLIIPQNNK